MGLAKVAGLAVVSLNWRASLPQEVLQKIAAKFSSEHPEIAVRAASAPDLFSKPDQNRVTWEDADVVTDVGAELHPELRGTFAAPLPWADPASVCPRLSPAGAFYVYTQAVPLSLRYVEEEIPAKALPASLAELAEGQWRGRCVLLEPNFSPEAACLYRFVDRTPSLGESWLKRMRASDPTVVLFASSMVRLYRWYGRLAWGLPDVFERQRLRARLPREGSPLLLYASVISAASARRREAARFIGWLASRKTQRYMESEGMSVSLEGDCGGIERDSENCLRGFARLSVEERRALLERASKALLGD